MSEYSNAILNAVKIVVDRENSKLARDLTVQGDIVSVVDADLGEYRVKYNGDIITVFARTPEEQYKIGERVFVTVPEGNFSGIKIIYGRVERSSLSTNNSTREANTVVEVSPTFDTIYGYDAKKRYGVICGAPVGSDEATCEIDSWPRDYYHGQFQRYADEYEYIRIRGTFTTELQSVHTSGNYGLELTFYTDDEPISYRLDVNSFNGGPYRLVTPSPQELILKVQKNYLRGLASIVLFEEGFDSYDQYVVDGQPSGSYNTDTPNIFVQDLVIQYVDKRDYSADSYYLAIATTKGNSFTSTVRELTLQGKLIFQGSDQYSTSSCSCQWFIQDPAITLGLDGYNKYAGIGWRLLPDETSNILTLSLSDEDSAWYQRKYKLIVTQNSRNVFSAEQEVFNLTSLYQSYYLEQTSSDGGLSLQIRDNSQTQPLVGEWYILYPDGKYSSLVNGEKRNSVPLENYLLYTTSTVYCTVYTPDGSSYLGILEYTIVNSSLQEDVTISYSGEDTFRYDANGDITIEDSEKERWLRPELSWKEGVYGTGAKLEWYAMDGTYLAPGGASLTIPSEQKSMISDIYLDNNYILHYHVRQKFRDYYNNNTLTLKIITSGNTYTFKKEILFLKDGDQGTNGTSYICAIRPCDINGNKLSEYTPLTYNGGWTNSVRLRCYVYRDGEPLDSTYTVTYKWYASSGISLTSDSTEQTIATGEDTLRQARYVKVQVAVRDNVATDRDPVNIYALYPLDVVVGNMTVSDIEIDIPQFIKYSASGVMPTYYNSTISCTYGAAAASFNPETPNLLTIDSNRLKPSPNFQFENNTIGLISCNFDSSRYILHSIVMFLNTFGNEAINGWDGTNLQTDSGFVLAPQVGAGEKDANNLFTGVVMGKDTAQTKVGLYGYQSGINTFGLREDGIAYFGRTGYGRIVINGQKAVIYGGANSASSMETIPSKADANGMIIRLSNLDGTSETKAIDIGANNFFVQYNGHMECTGATVRGKIEANSGLIGCDANGEGGWEIGNGIIKSHDTSIYLAVPGIAPYVFQAGDNFSVDSTGAMTAKSGYIGGWQIDATSLKGGSTVLDSSGTIHTNSITVGKTASATTGTMGYGNGSDGVNQTDLIILNSTKGIALEAQTNIRIQPVGGIYLEAASITFDIPAGQQHGIYARFA